MPGFVGGNTEGSTDAERFVGVVKEALEVIRGALGDWMKMRKWEAYFFFTSL